MDLKRYCQKGAFGEGEKCGKELGPYEYFFCKPCQDAATEKATKPLKEIPGASDSFLPVPPKPFWFERKAVSFKLERKASSFKHWGQRPKGVKEWARAAWNVDIFLAWFPLVKALTLVHILIWIWIWR